MTAPDAGRKLEGADDTADDDGKDVQDDGNRVPHEPGVLGRDDRIAGKHRQPRDARPGRNQCERDQPRGNQEIGLGVGHGSRTAG